MSESKKFLLVDDFEFIEDDEPKTWTDMGLAFPFKKVSGSLNVTICGETHKYHTYGYTYCDYDKYIESLNEKDEKIAKLESEVKNLREILSTGPKKISDIEDKDELEKECIGRFRRMWTYISELSSEEHRCVTKEEAIKALYPNDLEYLGKHSYCYLCYYRAEVKCGCDSCPVKWDSWNEECGSYSCFRRWVDARNIGDHAEASKYAAKIATLPLKEKSEESKSNWNGRVLCIDDHGCNIFTTGKIYNVVDGKICNDDDMYITGPYESFKDFVSVIYWAEFVLIDSDKPDGKESFREMCVRKFRAMWAYMGVMSLKQHRQVGKKEAIVMLYPDDLDALELPSYCYLCFYRNKKYGGETSNCVNCPINWGESFCGDSLYDQWNDSDDWDEAGKLALKISKLPEKKKLVIRDDRNQHYGIVGERTNMRDKNGRILHVGDVIVGKSRSGFQPWKHFVVKNEGKYFVMGIASACREDGKIDWDWEVEFHKSFRQAEPGDNYGILTIEEE